MNVQVTQLADVLEEEVSAGEELERNLAAQKQALIDWDVNGLLQQITARESWLRVLSALENKRIEVTRQIYLSSDAMTLRQLLSRLPQDAPETGRLRRLRGRGREIFTRLNRDERALHELMGNLVAHIQEALRPLLSPAAPLYSENGTAEAPRCASALIHSKV